MSLLPSKLTRLTNIKHYRKEYVKALYGRHGKSSGLNPGVMWPRKEELKFLKQYEAAFCPKLEDLIEENKLKKEQYLKQRKEREEFILAGLKKLPSEIKSFLSKMEEKKLEKEAWLQEREKMIEEVREFLGYSAKPSDPRFQEAIAQKEQEDIKARKKEAKKKRESASLEDLLAPTKEKKLN